MDVPIGEELKAVELAEFDGQVGVRHLMLRAMESVNQAPSSKIPDTRGARISSAKEADDDQALALFAVVLVGALRDSRIPRDHDSGSYVGEASLGGCRRTLIGLQGGVESPWYGRITERIASYVGRVLIRVGGDREHAISLPVDYHRRSHNWGRIGGSRLVAGTDLLVGVAMAAESRCSKTR